MIGIEGFKFIKDFSEIGDTKHYSSLTIYSFK